MVNQAQSQPMGQANNGDVMFYYAIMENMNKKPDIDWEGVARTLGLKNAEVARTRYRQVKQKIKPAEALARFVANKKTTAAATTTSKANVTTKAANKVTKATGRVGTKAKEAVKKAVKKEESDDDDDADDDDNADDDDDENDDE